MTSLSRKIALFAILLFIPSVVLSQHTVFPNTFEIALKDSGSNDYSDWNARAAASNCANLGINCILDNDEHRLVGNTTSFATSADDLKTLIEGAEFGLDCLDKAAVFVDRGQHVYPDVGYYEGPLHQFFVGEANRCWDHYQKIYEDNKDKF